MKHISAALLLTTALMTPALAADLPHLLAGGREPAYDPGSIAYEPTDPGSFCPDFYMGAHAGYSWGSADTRDPPLSLAPSGGLMGGQAGCNWHLDDHFILGLAGDFSLLNATTTGNQQVVTVIPGGESITTTDDYTWMEDIDSIATLRGVAGFDVGPFLLYGTAGLAAAHASFTASNASTYVLGGNPAVLTNSTAAGSGIHIGWTVGVGAEYKLTDHWGVDAHYSYTDFGTGSVPFVVSGGITGSTTMHLSAQSATLGLNYHF